MSYLKLKRKPSQKRKGYGNKYLGRSDGKFDRLIYCDIILLQFNMALMEKGISPRAPEPVSEEIRKESRKRTR